MVNPAVHVFRYTWNYSKGRRHKLVFFLGLSFTAAALMLLEPLLIARVFNSIQFSEGSDVLRDVFTNLLLFFAVKVVALSLHHTARVMELNHAFFVTMAYRRSLFEKALYMPLRWHKEHHSGETIDRIGKATGAIGSFSAQLFSITQSAVKIVGSVIILFVFDWTSSLIAVTAAALTFLVLFRFDVHLVKLYRAIMRFENYLAAGIQDYLTNIKTVVTLRLRPRVLHEIDERSMLSYLDVRRGNYVGELKWAFLSFTVPLAEVAVLMLYAYRSYVAEGVIVIGSLYALYSYLNNVSGTFSSFAGRYGAIMREDAAVTAAESIEEDFERLGVQQHEALPADWQTITIERLSFEYSGGSAGHRTTLHDISLTLQRGQRIALIGASGSGKSTLLALLRGLYEPQSAAVHIDGRAQPNGLWSVYGAVTLVPQEPEIFSSTIEDNITMGIPAPTQRVHEAAERARFLPVLQRLADGLLTHVNEKGVNLSGGEKQRLALARGLLAAEESDVLLLDEPTSSVDSANEVAIYTSIFAAFPQKTIISSVHRLHLLRHFDYIYYLDDGAVLAEGTYEQMQGNESFKNLVAHMKRP